jgi:hypothetical protein
LILSNAWTMRFATFGGTGSEPFSFARAPETFTDLARVWPLVRRGAAPVTPVAVRVAMWESPDTCKTAMLEKMR